MAAQGLGTTGETNPLLSFNVNLSSQEEEDVGELGENGSALNCSFQCPLCNYTANSSASLARHNGAVHKGGSVRTVTSSQGTRVLWRDTEETDTRGSGSSVTTAIIYGTNGQHTPAPIPIVTKGQKWRDQYWSIWRWNTCLRNLGWKRARWVQMADIGSGRTSDIFVLSAIWPSSLILTLCCTWQKSMEMPSSFKRSCPATTVLWFPHQDIQRWAHGGAQNREQLEGSHEGSLHLPLM